MNLPLRNTQQFILNGIEYPTQQNNFLFLEGGGNTDNFSKHHKKIKLKNTKRGSALGFFAEESYLVCF